MPHLFGETLALCSNPGTLVRVTSHRPSSCPQPQAGWPNQALPQEFTDGEKEARERWESWLYPGLAPLGLGFAPTFLGKGYGHGQTSLCRPGLCDRGQQELGSFSRCCPSSAAR